jgi:hypothetical protein
VTQRAVLQWSPTTGQVELASLLDLMHEQGHRLAWLDERPSIKQKYCDAPGGSDPVLRWERPINGSYCVARDAPAMVRPS